MRPNLTRGKKLNRNIRTFVETKLEDACAAC
jgi:hypothetical protein